MRRSACVIAMTLVVLLAAGCSTPSTGAQAPSPTRSSSPTATPTPTPTPTAEPADPGDPSTWVVSDAGIGPFTLGMPFAEAIAAVPGMRDACGWAYFAQIGDEPWEQLWITDIDGTLDHVSLGFEGPRTVEGVGVGSTTDGALAAYPDPTVVGRNLVYLQVGRMFFGYHDGDTMIIDVGVSRSGPLYEFCG